MSNSVRRIEAVTGAGAALLAMDGDDEDFRDR